MSKKLIFMYLPIFLTKHIAGTQYHPLEQETLMFFLEIMMNSQQLFLYIF